MWKWRGRMRRQEGEQRGDEAEPAACWRGRFELDPLKEEAEAAAAAAGSDMMQILIDGSVAQSRWKLLSGEKRKLERSKRGETNGLQEETQKANNTQTSNHK